MIFTTASSHPRPIRLSENIRAWANESMHGKYGDEAIQNDAVHCDQIPDFQDLSPIGQYDAAIRQIALYAPVRICPEEKICGAATLGLAISHQVPARFQGKPVFPSVSHLTIRYDKVIREGLDSYLADITDRLSDPGLSDTQREFLHSLHNVIESLRLWHARYLDATQNTRPDLHTLLQQVPFKPARTFHEALQSLWFVFAFVRLCGNWPGIGRLDWLLGDFLKRDLAAGIIDKTFARELLASFFIKGCEWIQSEPIPDSGDAQHYQNIVLGGVDSNGKELTNEVTYLALEVVEELAISDYPITVRLNEHSTEQLKRKIAEVMRHGGGIVAIYNEDLVLQALQNDGYPLEEARRFANDGCWEVQIPGKTNFIYHPFDAMQIFNRALGLGDETAPAFSSVEELYAAFLTGLKNHLQTVYQTQVADRFSLENGRWKHKGTETPTSVISLFEDGCIENACSYHEFGPTYLVRSPHIGGAPDVANSLYAIQKAVFEENKTALPDLIEILRRNWEGEEALRLYIRNKYTYYGNDCDAENAGGDADVSRAEFPGGNTPGAASADLWHARILNDFADLVRQCSSGQDYPCRFIPGVSTFGRQIEWLPNRMATAFGYKKGDILSGNDSPTPGTDSAGATAIIRSHCKADLVKQSCGAALDIKIYPNTLSGETGITALVSLMDGFLKLGGFFLQLDTLDMQTLLDAQKNPQNHKTLSVRVSGWNARFVTLNKEWQTMIIERTAQNL